MKLKRYLVFDFPDYYPGGGWQDFEGSFDTLEEARQLSCRQIIDSETGTVVEERHNGNRIRQGPLNPKRYADQS